MRIKLEKTKLGKIYKVDLRQPKVGKNEMCNK